jgi:hypothetical protein
VAKLQLRWSPSCARVNYTILVQIKSFDLNRLQQLCVPLPFQMQEDERGEIKFEIVVR